MRVVRPFSLLRPVPNAHTPATLGAPAPRRPWTFPELTPLPPLEQLTLQTGGVSGTCSPGTGCTFSFLPASDREVRRG